jgi:glycosyltransferase involved in cell wall biosynthesis
MEKSFRILQVNSTDGIGGAAKMAYDLHCAYRNRGYPAWLAVGYKCTDDPHVLPIPHHAYSNAWARLWLSFENWVSPSVGKVRGAGRLRNWLHFMGEPKRSLEFKRGHEDFEFPGTSRILGLLREPPDILHCHNLHPGYFDLEALPWLSQQVPVVLTLHDAWLLGGHCAHSFDCERWKIGCGHCPDLTIYPAIRRDATAFNWRRKQDIYIKSRLYVATPCQWLMQKVEQSILAPVIVEARVIPNGVDLSVFHPADKHGARAVLSIPQDSKVLLFTANGIRKSTWKDYPTMRAAVALVAERMDGQGVLFFALGEDAPAERIGQAELRFISYQKDPEIVARYYQAADVYVHAARADTFPTSVLESMACGTPVVATSVGGIPEQVEVGATGLLVSPGDAKAMAESIMTILTDDTLRLRLGYNAAANAQKHFGLNRLVDDYTGWYRQILDN